MTDARTLHLAAISLTSSMLVSAPVLAGDFKTDGTFVFNHDAVVQQGFESAPVVTGGGHKILQDGGALEGTHTLSIATNYQSVDLAVQLPTDKKASYAASVWIKGDGVVALAVGYPDGSPGVYAQLFPSGRMTSDGWVEMKSEAVSVDGGLHPNATLFFLGSLQADAAEIFIDKDKPFRPTQRCDGVQDPSCDGDNVCLGGWCRDMSGWLPPLPPTDKRATMVAYLSNRIRFFFGPYDNRHKRMPLAIESMKTMAQAKSSWAFWNGFATAVRRLNDTHSYTSSLSQWVVQNHRPMNVCFIVGQADLDPSATDPGPELLVSRAGNKYAWGLQPGDRLVAVDHISPIVWARSLVGVDWNYTLVDDQSSLSMVAEQLRLPIPRYASSITVVNCSTGTCGQPHDIMVADMPKLAPGEQVSPVMCDHRINKVVSSQPSSHNMGANVYAGPVLGTDSSEHIYGLVLDALLIETPGATAIAKAVNTWRQDAEGVIIDHRLGNGGSGEAGTTASADPIIAFVRTPTTFGVQFRREASEDEGPSTLAEGLDLVAAYKDSNLTWHGGSASARTDVPVALLVTRDVSFSDLFPHAMKGAPHVRIFGPHPTNGAYSSFFSLSYGFGLKVQLAEGDIIAADGSTLCGHGVRPDEVVWPLQSDIIAGKDTLLDRARQWVRSEQHK